MSGDVTVEVLLGPDDLRAALVADARAGLTAVPKSLPPKWFYDERGSELFEEITRLPEYYPTRCERSILAARAGEVASLTQAAWLVELGSGASEKTRLLLDTLGVGGGLTGFVAFDVSEAFLCQAAARLAADHPGLAVHAVVGDFEHHLGCIATAAPSGPRLVAFLGGTIGNLEPDERARFLSSLSSSVATGDWLLLGTDLVKDVGRLEAAYDDAAGVTAAFNRNVLEVLNRELDADFALDRFAHVACFDKEQEWIEMRLRSEVDQVVAVHDLGLEVSFAEGEEMRTEVSAKFRREGVEIELAAAGFELARWWTDAGDDFALSLSVRR